MSQRMRQPLEEGTYKDTYILPQNLQKGMWPADTLILFELDTFQTSNLQKCKIINLYSFTL